MTAHLPALPVLLLALSATPIGVLKPDLPARTAVAAPGAPAPVYRWPLDGPVRVVRPFDPPAQPWLPGHRGVDIATPRWVPQKGLVRAAGPGVVRYAGELAGRGVLSVAHENGLRTTYEPVQAQVPVGRRVLAGDVLGVLTPGHPGCPEQACLHWGLRRDAVSHDPALYLDPLALLGLGRVRLLPMDVATAPRGGRSTAAVGGPSVLGGWFVDRHRVAGRRQTSGRRPRRVPGRA